MSNRSRKTKDHRFLFILIFCALSGAILNGSAGYAESRNCVQSKEQCVRKAPVIGAIEGGMMGLFAGTGAAIGATWRRYF